MGQRRAARHDVDPAGRRRYALRAGIDLDEGMRADLRSLALADAEPRVRSAALWSLGRLRASDQADVLVEGLDDERASVRAVAAWALTRLGPSGRSTLERAAAGDGRLRVRALAGALLERSRRREPDVASTEAERLSPLGEAERLFPLREAERLFPLRAAERPSPLPAAEPGGPDGSWVEGAVHDLINLVQGIVGELDGLRAEPSLAAEARERIVFAEEAARFLRDVGASLLDAGRLEAGRAPLRFEAVDLAEVAAEATTLGLPPADGRRLALRVPAGGLCVRTDRVRLLRVLLNLVWNACKHSDRKERVVLVVRRLDAEAWIEVRDRGPGFGIEERERVLDAFRTGSRTTGEGWGLGLSTAVRLLRQIRGRLELLDRPIKGSVVRVRLPIDRPDGSASDDAPVVAGGEPTR